MNLPLPKEGHAPPNRSPASRDSNAPAPALGAESCLRTRRRPASVGHQKGRAAMNASLWLLVLIVPFGYLGFRLEHKRRARRDDSRFDIPEFLSGRPDAPNKVGGVGPSDWLEIHPFPKRRR